jgi:aryl-alcohol dehydrogenase-like predicted oxidoreductase
MTATPAAAAGELALGGLRVNRIGLGARFVQDAEHSRPLLQRALELGVNLIDTADVYGNSEEAIAAALHPYPDGLVIATKGGQTLVDGQPTGDGRPEYLKEACERSLNRLRVDTIDIYQLHMPDPDVPLEESVGALAELRREGKVREIGLSNVFGAQLELARRTAPIVSVQNRYSLMHRDSETEIAICEREGMAYMPWWPLAGGELAQVGAQNALAWLLQRSPAMLPIPGTGSTEHLEQNVAAAGRRLTADEVARLEAQFR